MKVPEWEAWSSDKNTLSLIDNARLNEQINQRFHKIELNLLACRTLKALLGLLLQELKQMMHLDIVSLTLVDAESFIQDILHHEGVTKKEIKQLQILPTEQPLSDFYKGKFTPGLVRLQPARPFSLKTQSVKAAPFVYP